MWLRIWIFSDEAVKENIEKYLKFPYRSELCKWEKTIKSVVQSSHFLAGIEPQVIVEKQLKRKVMVSKTLKVRDWGKRGGYR